MVNSDGIAKMIKAVNTGWLSADKMNQILSPKTYVILMGIIVIVAVIRGIIFVAHLFNRH